jgi:beta-phosphoglucomutase-like phosphatase (HAD superfamily)
MNPQQGSLKAVVFDVDGTLIDSVDVHAQAWVDAFAEFGHEVRFGDARRQIGKGSDQLMPVFLSKAEIDRFGEKLEERRGVLFKERYFHRIKPFAAVRELFQRVIADGKAIALASSAKEDELAQYKKIANIVDLMTSRFPPTMRRRANLIPTSSARRWRSSTLRSRAKSS